MISKHYQFSETEKNIYTFWERTGCFHSAYDQEGKPQDSRIAQLQELFKFQQKYQTNKKPQKKLEQFAMVIPPPNVTGRLHMGHALNNTIQDLIIRYHRMQGKDVLWVPGTDHAGIATQTVVKKMLDGQNIDYRNLGREMFNQAVWKWKEKYGDIILRQLRSLGISCDWNRVAYTMDPVPSTAVRYAFVQLYEAGYIYRAKRIVNWCPVDKTALSDDEVETAPEGEPGFLYQIAYPVMGDIANDKLSEIVVSTTRPETIFGDVAVAVHPEDERYSSLIGRELRLPLTDRTIPIIADDYVDRTFGTGCLKITPAHDPNDFTIGQKHDFAPIDIMHDDATLNDEVPLKFRKLTREDARKKVVTALEVDGFFRGKTERMVPVGRSYRSKAIIEYRLSNQWFVKMTPLADKVIKQADLNIYPANYQRLWGHWLNNIKDWCISRQIWWGHQIPAWFNQTTGEILVSGTTPKEVKDNPQAWKQDEDVLDTWFSSALWPMSTLGWPQTDSPDFKRYFPTTALSTAKDIIFFWVARMCLMSLFFEKKLPFQHVYFHPTVMDHRGKIMSKSKGNGIDPQHIISGATVDELKAPVLDARPSNMEEMLKEIEEKFKSGFIGVGADAMRYTLIYLSSHMQSLQLSLDSFLELGRRFTDKLWNASRLVFLYLEKITTIKSFNGSLKGKSTTSLDSSLAIANVWMDARIYHAWGEVKKAIEQYDFSNLGQTYYNLVWSDFCDWYLEAVKLKLGQLDETEKSDNKTNEGVVALLELIHLFEKILVLLHPLVPFLTEELYQKLLSWSKKQEFGLRATESLMVSSFLLEDEFYLKKEYSKGESNFKLVQDAVTTLRTYKKSIFQSVNSAKGNRETLTVFFTSNQPDVYTLFKNEQELIMHLAKVGKFSPLPDASELKSSENGELIKLVKENFILFIKPTVNVNDEENHSVINEEAINLLKTNLTKLIQDEKFITKRLANQGFVENAKPELIKKERERLQKIKQAVIELKDELLNHNG